MICAPHALNPSFTSAPLAPSNSATWFSCWSLMCQDGVASGALPAMLFSRISAALTPSLPAAQMSLIIFLWNSLLLISIIVTGILCVFVYILCPPLPQERYKLMTIQTFSVLIAIGPFLSFFAYDSISVCVSAHPPMPDPALPSLLLHSNMPCSECIPSVPRNRDRAQTLLSKGPSFSCLSPSILHLSPNPLSHLLLPEGIYFAHWQLFSRVPCQPQLGIYFGIAIALQ